jgi:hypothetical protein
MLYNLKPYFFLFILPFSYTIVKWMTSKIVILSTFNNISQRDTTMHWARLSKMVLHVLVVMTKKPNFRNLYTFKHSVWHTLSFLYTFHTFSKSVWPHSNAKFIVYPHVLKIMWKKVLKIHIYLVMLYGSQYNCHAFWWMDWLNVCFLV